MSNNSEQLSEPAEHESPHWSRSTKVIVTVAALVLVSWVTYRFQSLISQIIIAAILAYVLNPIIVQLDKRTALKRSTGILIVYLLLALAVIGGFVALGFAAFEQISSLIEQVPKFIEDITAIIEEFAARTDPFVFGPFSLDPGIIDIDLIPEQIIGLVEPAVSQGG